jgi:hypothetical protein
MKNALLFILLAALTLPSVASDRKYRKSMEASLESLNKAAGQEDYLATAAAFETIAGKFTKEWIPLYYSAQALIFASFSEPAAPVRDSMLGRAQASLDGALILDPDESELHSMQAMLTLAKIAVKPDVRGPLNYESLNQSLHKARELNPGNPRACYLQGLLVRNLPEFMGGGPGPAKPLFEEASALFKEFSNDDPFWPSWGADLNQQELDRLQEP